MQSPRSVTKFLHVVMMTLSNLGDPETAILLGVHWVQSPRSVAKFLHVVMMTLSNLGYSLVQDNRSLEEAELEGELVL